VGQKSYLEAVAHYNKALISLKMLFESEDNLIDSEETAVNLVKDIEVPCCLNLGLCYLKLKNYHMTIKYCSQAIDREGPSNAKALYRRGVAYKNIGETKKAMTDLKKAHELTQGGSADVNQALQELKEKIRLDKEREAEVSRRMVR